MQTHQFAVSAKEGADNYLNYLEETGRGHEEIKVDRIEREDTVYLLYLSKNPFSTETVHIVIGTQEYTQKEIEVIEQDRDKRIIYVKPSKELPDPFYQRYVRDIRVVSDLKFLVQRIHDWYKANDTYLAFHNHYSQAIPEHIYQQDMSAGQLTAVKDIFTYPKSYVWGAPGTGKTRYVLAECLLQCIKQGKKVAVLAPTNNAIEQVLYGVLPKLQEYNISFDSVIRLGTPTSKFTEKYPEICEVQGIEKQLKSLQEQIDFLKRVLSHRRFLTRLKFAEEQILPAFDKAMDLLADLRYANLNCKDADAACKVADRKEREATVDYIRAIHSMQVQEKHMQSVGYRIKSGLSEKTAREGKEQIRELTEHVKQANSACESARRELTIATENAKKTKEFAVQIDSRIDQAIKELKKNLSSIERFREISQSLNRINLASSKEKIADFINTGIKVQLEGIERYSEYSQVDDESITERIAEIEYSKKFLAEQSTQKRLGKAQIVAATIDTFLFRNQPCDTDHYTQYDHIFLDEAGYCSLIKGMALLGYQCPVTLLGDHMQLPPVCELDDAELSKPQYSGAFLFAQSAIYLEEAIISNGAQQLLSQYLSHEAPSFRLLHRSNLHETHRFGIGLSDILERHVYKNGFTSAGTRQEFVIEVLDAKRVPGALKRQNSAEIEAISERIAYLATDDYAILTPYRNQVALIGQMLQEERKAERIMTVHASQGREWDTVFLSIVDTSDMYFTNSKRTELGGLQIINTAVSRAKRRLIIACDKQFWTQQRGQLIRELVIISDSLTT